MYAIEVLENELDDLRSELLGHKDAARYYKDKRHTDYYFYLGRIGEVEERIINITESIEKLKRQ